MPTTTRPGPAPRRLRRLAAALAAVGALLLAACGDDDADGDDPTTTTTEVDDTTTTTEVDDTTTTTENEGAEEWTPFSDPETGLTVDLPGDPASFSDEIEVEPGNVVTIHAHVVESVDSAITFGVYELSLPVFDLDASVEGAAGEIGGTVESSEEIEYEGLEGRDAVVTISDPSLGEGIALLRVVSLADEQQAVQISVIGPADDRDDLQELFDRVVGSLVI